MKCRMSNNAVPVMRCLIAMTILGAAGLAIAQPLPRAFDASPDIYRVVSEDDKYLVVEANFKPGQRSKFFSSPAWLSYFVTDCHLRKHFPGGQMIDNGPVLAGFSVPAPAHDSAAYENVGANACRQVMFAPK